MERKKVTEEQLLSIIKMYSLGIDYPIIVIDCVGKYKLLQTKLNDSIFRCNAELYYSSAYLPYEGARRTITHRKGEFHDAPFETICSKIAHKYDIFISITNDYSCDNTALINIDGRRINNVNLYIELGEN